MKRYDYLVNVLSERIEQGFYPAGDRLPSIRNMSSEHGVSISTVQQAYRVLEEKMLVEVRPKSGYFVTFPADGDGQPSTKRRAQAALPAVCRPAQRPVDISQWDQVLDMITSARMSDAVQFYRGTPDIFPPTLKPRNLALSRASRHQNLEAFQSDSIFGVLGLREEIARLIIDSGNYINASNIIITTGCHEALSIAIRSVCQAGDIVAVDSPSFHGVMQTLRGNGIKALEIATDPVTGMSIEALEMALNQWPIKAIQLTANCNSPLGFNMPDERKKALLRLAQSHDIAIIEDDVYGDLSYQYPRPSTISSFDEDGRVLLCSSFSKTIAPGLRIGWLVPGRYYDRCLYMKYISTGRTTSLTQIAVTDFIKQGHYSQHLRRMRNQYQKNLRIMTGWVNQYFPCDTRVSRPQGGFMLWIELDKQLDTQRLNKLLEEHNIAVAVGSIFSASGKYRNCLRLNYSQPLNEIHQQAMQLIGRTIKEMMVLK
ncbi:PLP-dependent aminotransferase family protein [Ewingella americana]|uniref:aminotransferase-like domain-containing protein n=1 Tax=Ewingella americana TaxID=41202 RepID=UPI00163A626E|nr:PLP-dependent aminotransferase family protein [Ewingella americana]QMV54044.1 PLP-dependent aminotransferase family protein [Ewingella americana]